MSDPTRYYLDVKTAVWIPSLQALISAALWAVAGFGLSSVANFVLGATITPWVPAVVAFCVVSVISFRTLIDDWRVAMYGSEAEQPEAAQLIAQPPEPIRIEIHSQEGRRVQFADLPVRPDQLKALGDGIANGKTFSEGSWVGGVNGVFTRSEFVALRDVLLQRGFIAWRSYSKPSAGVEITRGGLSLFRNIAHLPDLEVIDQSPIDLKWIDD